MRKSNYSKWLGTLLLCCSLIATNFQQLSAQCAPGQVFQTARHYNNTNASLPFGNTVTTSTASSIGTVDFIPFSTGAAADLGVSFQATSNFISDGGSMRVSIDDTEEGTVTYNFCRPVTNPYIFIGGPETLAEIQRGTVIEAIGKTLTLIDGKPGFIVQAGNQITNDGTGADMVGGYVQVAGTMSSLTLRITNSSLFGSFTFDTFHIGIGSCLTPTAPVGVPLACTGPNVMTPVDFQAIGATPTMFNSAPQTSANLFTNLYDEFGQKVDVSIETVNATANYCGNFNNNATVAGTVVTNTTTVGGGVAYWYTFSRPVKVAINSVGSLPLKEGETVMITTFTGGANQAIASITAGTSGLISTMAPDFPGITMIEGGINGVEWKVEPVLAVTRICIVYMTSNPNQLSEAHQLQVCNRPCALRTPACNVRNDTRTSTTRFQAINAPNAASGNLNGNNFTMTSPVTAPLAKLRMTGSNRLGECGDADKFGMPRAGGWIELCSAAATNGNVTFNFATPLADPVVHIWDMKSGSMIDFTPTTCCVNQVRAWKGAVLNNNPGGFPTIVTDGDGGSQADGAYQLNGVFSTITFNLTTAERDWIFISVGSFECNGVEEDEVCVPDPLFCLDGVTECMFVGTQFNNTFTPSTASGLLYSPESQLEDNTVSANVANPSGGLSIIGTATNPIGTVSYTDDGCGPRQSVIAGGGKLKMSAAEGNWTNGLLNFNFSKPILNPIVRFNKIVNTRFSFAPTFDVCGNDEVNVVQLLTQGGFAVAGCATVSDANAWADGMQGSGTVQLIGVFSTISIDVDKIGAGADKFEISVQEQICIDPATINYICTADLPSCINGGQLTSNAATFSKTSSTAATGMMMVDGQAINVNVSSTNTILAASPNRAMQAFRDPACFDILPLGGGLVMYRDMGGNNTITYNFDKTVCNPIIYVRDLIRTQLNFANTLNANGTPICCIKRISGSGGFTVTGFNVMDSNPTQDGDCQNAIKQSGGIVQLIGNFNTITINTSRPSDSRFDNYSLGLASDPMCMDIPAPLPWEIKKKINNITLKDPSNPTGNQIVTFVVEAKNNTAVKFNNVFIADFLDEKFTLTSGFVAIASAPKVTWPHLAAQHGNPNFNGITEFDLLTTATENNMIEPGCLLRLEYSVEFNPSQFNPAWRYENKLFVGSLDMPVFSPDFKDFNLPICLPSSIVLPSNPTVDIVNGSAPMEFASWLQGFGGTRATPHPQCGKITWGFNQCIAPYTQNCGNTGVHHSQFTGMDECGNMYMYPANFTTIDKHAPSWDMKPMDKTINCNDATGGAELTKWLNSAGSAWFTDPGDEKNSKITVTHDFNGVNPNCSSGARLIKFTLTDVCNNSTSASANLTVIDNKAPNFTTVPANTTVKCDATHIFGAAIAIDDCGLVTLTQKDTTNGTDCINGGTRTRTWTATDACGNTATASQTIYFEPSGNVVGTKTAIVMAKKVSDKIINCSDAMDFDKPEMTTSCPDGVISSTFSDEKVGGTCAMEYEVIRTWNFADKCGNKYEVKQNISLSDSDAPVFDKTLPTTFSMKKGLFKVWQKLFFMQVKATDNCSNATLTAPVYKILSDKAVECKIIAKDDCGNAAAYVCVVTFDDVKTVTANKEASTNSDVAKAIIADLEVYIKDETPIDIPIEAVIYPNPTSRVVNIIPAKGYGDIQKIHIYSMDGRNLLNMDVEGQQEQTISIDISNFANATYIIEMIHTQKRMYRQVAKIK